MSSINTLKKSKNETQFSSSGYLISRQRKYEIAAQLGIFGNFLGNHTLGNFPSSDRSLADVGCSESFRDCLVQGMMDAGVSGHRRRVRLIRLFIMLIYVLLNKYEICN